MKASRNEQRSVWNRNNRVFSFHLTKSDVDGQRYQLRQECSQFNFYSTSTFGVVLEKVNVLFDEMFFLFCRNNSPFNFDGKF